MNHQMNPLEILKNTAVSGCKNSDSMINLVILMVVMVVGEYDVCGDCSDGSDSCDDEFGDSGGLNWIL